MNNEITVNDEVFGLMTYKHRWIKKQDIQFIGNKFSVTIAAKAYSQKPISDEQRESYNFFISKEKDILDKAEQSLLVYAKAFEKSINSENDLKNFVKPKTILFNQNGTRTMLLECSWDEENGIGIDLNSSFKVDVQDAFL